MPIAADRMLAINSVAIRASEKLRNEEQHEAESRGKEKERTKNEEWTENKDLLILRIKQLIPRKTLVRRGSTCVGSV